MTVSYLDYQLVDGYIHNWLVAGPQVVLIQNLESFNAEEEESTLQGIYKELPEHYHGQEVDFNIAPADLVEFEVDSTKLTWHYYRCLDDHFVDLSASYPLWSYLRAWAYTQIKSPEAQEATLVLTTSGPADVWLNGTHIHRQEHFHPHEPQSVRIPVQLGKGDDQVLVRTVGRLRELAAA